MTKAALSILGFLCNACAPEFVDHTWFIDEPRLLAVRAEPAEAKPGAEITLHALVAVPFGTPEPELNWNYCTTPKPLTQNNSVANACLDLGLQNPIGVGTSVRTKLPADSCRLFGPEAPPGEIRARDPDVTGGYFQPLVIRVDKQAAVHLQRLQCTLAAASAEVATQFAHTYQANNPPHVVDVKATIKHKAVELNHVPLGAEVTLSVSWNADAAEVYSYLDSVTQTLTDKQETLQLRWHTDAGTLLQAFSVPDNAGTESHNTWVAPNLTGEFQLWVVLRDSRGGVDFAALRGTVSD